jgi:CO/xanthine dehydrogenase FAD-binding subunit
MGIQEFWTGAGKVALERGEILTGVRLPRYERKMVSRYQRISRTKGMDLAALGVTVAVISPDNPAKREVRVAMAAVERTPYRNAEVESLLSGRVLDDQVVASAKKLMAISIHPRDTSIRAKPFYKRAMVGTLAERILDELSLVEA